MATRANREAYSAIGKVVGGCAAMGTCFSIVDATRNPTPHNFMSVCIFGFASWALLAGAVKIKQPSFATSAPAQASEKTIVGWAFGSPPWIRPVLWFGLFLILLALASVMILYRAELRLSVNALKLMFMLAIAFYLLSCQRLEALVRTWLRSRYPDKPQVAISATGLWITGTEIPWSSIQAITRRTRSVRVINVDTIVIRAQSGLVPENIEIDLSDSVEDSDALYAKLQSAAAAHGAPLQTLGRKWRTAATVNLQGSQERIKESREGLEESRELLRKVREQAEQRRSKLPEEMAKTEAQIEAVSSRIDESKKRISELEASLAEGGRPNEQRQKTLELTRANLQANLRLRDSLTRLLQTQRNSCEKPS